MIKLSFCAMSVAMVLGTTAHAETIQSAVEHAIRFNPDVLLQTAKKLSSEQGLREKQGGFYPSIDLTAGVGREKTLSPTTIAINPPIFGPGGTSTSDPNAIVLSPLESNLALTQNLFAGGAIVGEIERLQNQYNAELLKIGGVADDVALQVVQQYLNVLKGYQNVAFARDNLAKHNALLGMVRERQEAGLDREGDLQQALGRVALAQANLISEQANLRESKISYLRIVGLPAENLQWPSIPSARDLPSSRDSAVEYALLNHPTLKSAVADVEEAKSQHKVAKATNYPRVDLVLDATRNEDVYGLVGVNQSTSAKVKLSYNLFRGGADLAHQRMTAYQVQEAFEIKNRTTEQVKESMRLSWNAWITSKARLSYLRAYRDASGKTLAAYHEQFKIAKRTLLDLLDSTNENYQAKLDYVDGIYKEIYARYRLLNSAGRLVPYLALYTPVDIRNSDFMTSHEFFDHGGMLTPENRNMYRMAANGKAGDQAVQVASISDMGTKVDDLVKLTEAHGDDVLHPAAVVAKAEPKPLIPAEAAKAPLVTAAKSAEPAKAPQVAIVQPVEPAKAPILAAAKPAQSKNETVAQASNQKAWYVQTGKFDKADDAQKLLSDLHAKGFSTAFAHQFKDKVVVYIGPYQYRGEAVQAQGAVKSSSNLFTSLAYMADLSIGNRA